MNRRELVAWTVIYLVVGGTVGIGIAVLLTRLEGWLEGWS